MSWLRRSRGEVLLVVDDGPTESTNALLDALVNAGQRAVLFVLGMNIAGREGVLIRAIESGFALGNHSFTHPHFSQIDLRQAREEIHSTEAEIERLYQLAGRGRPGKWFRFPYLDTGGTEAHYQSLQRLLGEFAFESLPANFASAVRGGRCDWPSTVLTRDWALPPLEEFASSVRGACAGDVVEMHDKPESLRYIPLLLSSLKRNKLNAVVPGAV